MAYLSKYGTLWGGIPRTAGKIWWVAPSSSYTVDGRSYSASDNNAGDSPEKALATIQQAITNATANAGEIIMLLPGTSQHTSAATVTLNKAGLTFIGCHPAGQLDQVIRNIPYAINGGNKVQWTSTFAGAAVTCTVADTTFSNIAFVPKTAQTFFTGNASASNTIFQDCAVLMSASASTSTKGIVFSGAADSVALMNCNFHNTIGAQGPAMDLTAVTNFHVQNCVFVNTTGTWAIAVQLGAGSTGAFLDCDVINRGTAITTFVDGTGVAAAASVYAARCYQTVSPAATNMFKNFTSTDLANVNCYIATISGGTGSTLITTTT